MILSHLLKHQVENVPLVVQVFYKRVLMMKKKLRPSISVISMAVGRANPIMSSGKTELMAGTRAQRI